MLVLQKNVPLAVPPAVWMQMLWERVAALLGAAPLLRVGPGAAVTHTQKEDGCAEEEGACCSQALEFHKRLVCASDFPTLAIKA